MKPVSLEQFEQHLNHGDRVGFVLYEVRPEAALSDTEAAARKAAGETLKMVDGWHQVLSQADKDQMALDAENERLRKEEEARRPPKLSAEARIAALEALVEELKKPKP